MTTYRSVQAQNVTIEVGGGLHLGSLQGVVTAIEAIGLGWVRITLQPTEGQPIAVDSAFTMGEVASD